MFKHWKGKDLIWEGEHLKGGQGTGLGSCSVGNCNIEINMGRKVQNSG